VASADKAFHEATAPADKAYLEAIDQANKAYDEAMVQAGRTITGQEAVDLLAHEGYTRAAVDLLVHEGYTRADIEAVIDSMIDAGLEALALIDEAAAGNAYDGA
jgi:hypothetical protein